ncbi:hypothetical protein CPB83DRAFT_806226 [Crepidotus variabilis]|uniref:NudC domain-containing protein 1 n=1 Tax=Crepidotus variabilis TaxID=179855 RepID=A0A9P6JTK7_9AGAR|nr:hypothetical protein CPB83DRAFT_806226 [Crepidotus variabilis]
MDFKINRRVLNPKFEGYKLDPIRQEDAVSRFKLTRKPTQATTSTRLPLTFEEMRSRIGHNHLAVEGDAGLLLYVDSQLTVCLISLPTNIKLKDDISPSFRALYEMATPMDLTIGTGGITVQKEYPSASFLGPSAAAVADGNGLLYVLPIKDEHGFTEPVGIFTLRTGGAVNSPFKIQHCHRLSPITAVLLLSSRHYPEDKPNQNSSHSRVEFDLWAVKIELLSLRTNAQQRELEVFWHRRGQDVPVYATFVEEIKSYLIISGSSYPDGNILYNRHYEPTPEEMAPVPREGELLGHFALDSDLAEPPPKPHPYSWTQSPDAITVAFPLPSTTSKTDIKVLFTVQTLTLHIKATPLPASDSTALPPLPHYTTKQLWDSVNTSSCFWTWDKEAEHSYGLLTLHMEKKHEDTRWMQVFATASMPLGSIVTERNPTHDVPESVDPSEMVKIRESMEKWTGSLLSGEDSSGLGLGTGIPTLMEGEMDDEVDAQVGRKVLVTWIGEGGTTPEWTKGENGTDSRQFGARQEQWEDVPITILSTPLPGPTLTAARLNLILKQDLDGAVFSLINFNSTPSWEHTSTYSALAFVLASKQDTRFTYHLPSKGVLAFEGGSLRDRGANVYLYRPTKGKELWAKQSVLQVENGGGGAVLGVGYINLNGSEGDDILVACLTEEELVLIKGI